MTEQTKKKKIAGQTDNDLWLAAVKIKGDTDGRAKIYIDGQLVHGVIGYKIEHNSSDKRVPLLTLEVQCSLEMESGAIPLLPEPWTWFYEPKLPDFVDERDYLKSLSEECVKE